LALNWVRTVLGMEWDVLFGEAEAALTMSPDDPTFVPYLAGERDPAVGLDARGAWLDLSVSHDAAALARSALLGVGSYLAHRTRMLVELTEGQRVVLSGGSTRNLGWAQLLTTLTGREVDIAGDAHASVRGAAILAARSQGDDIPVSSDGGHLEPQAPLLELADACIARLASF
jgi:xylulokinase